MSVSKARTDIKLNGRMIPLASLLGQPLLKVGTELRIRLNNFAFLFTINQSQVSADILFRSNWREWCELLLSHPLQSQQKEQSWCHSAVCSRLWCSPGDAGRASRLQGLVRNWCDVRCLQRLQLPVVAGILQEKRSGRRSYRECSYSSRSSGCLEGLATF